MTVTAAEYVKRAVDRALNDETPQLHAAVREEIVALWTDLDSAIKAAVDGSWSMQCDWIVERIAVLTHRTSAVITTDELPETFPVERYRQIITAINAHTS